MLVTSLENYRKMSIKLIELPKNSDLHKFIKKGDFVDCYNNDDVNESISITQATMVALAQMPKWVDGLMKIRNFAVSFYGLKTGADIAKMPLDKTNFIVGDHIGLFRIQSITKDEILIGEDDKHLNFLISILRHKGGISLATWVQTHNWFGRIYLKTIMPFHKIIVRNAVQRISE